MTAWYRITIWLIMTVGSLATKTQQTHWCRHPLLAQLCAAAHRAQTPELAVAAGSPEPYSSSQRGSAIHLMHTPHPGAHLRPAPAAGPTACCRSVLCHLRRAGSDAQLPRKRCKEHWSYTRHSVPVLWGSGYFMPCAVKDFTGLADN